MTLGNRGVPSGFSSLVASFMAAAMRRANRKDLALLKQRLEPPVLSDAPTIAACELAQGKIRIGRTVQRPCGYRTQVKNSVERLEGDEFEQCGR
jgi:hypothetical protein